LKKKQSIEAQLKDALARADKLDRERNEQLGVLLTMRLRLDQLEKQVGNQLAETERANAACRKLSMLRTILGQA
jgi:hypothetical protein